MFKKFLGLAIWRLSVSCDDGDIFVAELDFGENLQHCEGTSDVIIYKTKTNPDESLSIKMPLAVMDYFTIVGEETESLSTAKPFSYRSYSGNPSALFCSVLPPAEPVITNNSESANGLVRFNTELVG